MYLTSSEGPRTRTSSDFTSRFGHFCLCHAFTVMKTQHSVVLRSRTALQESFRKCILEPSEAWVAAACYALAAIERHERVRWLESSVRLNSKWACRVRENVCSHALLYLERGCRSETGQAFPSNSMQSLCYAPLRFPTLIMSHPLMSVACRAAKRSFYTSSPYVPGMKLPSRVSRALTKSRRTASRRSEIL